MAICPSCHNEVADTAAFCGICGTPLSAPTPAPAPAQAPNPAPAPQYVAYTADPHDHTAQFSADEIQRGKLYAMISYLLGMLGIIIALLAQKENGFVQFHVHQALKLVVVETLTGVFTALLCWTIIVPLAACLFLFVLFVLMIVAFVQAAQGKAKELPILRSLNF